MNPRFKIKKKVGAEMAKAFDKDGIDGILKLLEPYAKTSKNIKILEPPYRDD